MAKDKKKGFFSWLGFGRKDEKETQQQEAEQQKIDAAKANELQQQDNEAAIKAAEDEAERQYQEKQAQEQAAIKAAEEEAERLHQAQQAELKAAQEEAERQRQAELAAEKAAQEQAERDRQAAEAARVAEEAERQRQAELAAAKAAAEQAERDRQAAEAARVAEEAERQRQAELAAAKAAAEQAERDRQAAEAARVAEEAERQRQAELATAKAAAEQAERDRQAAEAARVAEEEAERQRQAELAAAKAAAEQAERDRQAAEAARVAEEEAERQRQAELAAAKAAAEQAERDRQAAEAARVAEEEAERQRQVELEAAKAAAEQAERDRQAAEAARVAEEEAERQRQAAEQAELEAQEIVALRDEVLSEQTEEEEPKQVEQEKPKKEGFFSRLKKGLLKTRQNLGSGFLGLFTGKKIDDDLFDELEEQLLIADVGVETTRKIIDNLTAHASRKDLKNAEALYGRLREEMSDILAGADKPLVIEDKKPYVILMVGVNGVGKTTTIGKLARQYQSEGKSVMLAAGDTFRAAAVEQLQVWGERNQIPVVAQHTGADPASVIFDAIQSAQAKGVDVLIADTAGRLQNKAHLMEELKKIVRVMKKLDEEAPHEIMLTLDASTGQNAVSQAKLFNDAVGLTGITLTKLDGTAKGGVIFSIADQFGIPIRYIGIGEGIEDLRPFKADDFIEALFAREE
ncbi:signal recognition particle-docking protein FtsY [Providencia manganoxydans]|uniref:signal recognition particle-docking protein FtsY n=1 Tax=Providencia manganoxydans TaxID=2923283 RepID=UPI0032DB66A6